MIQNRIKLPYCHHNEVGVPRQQVEYIQNDLVKQNLF